MYNLFSKNGVKVRVTADALGARMHWYFKYKNKPFIEELRKAGIEVVLSSDKNTLGNYHFDHRKFFIIDGYLGQEGGYSKTCLERPPLPPGLAGGLA